MNDLVKCTSQSASTIVGIEINICFIWVNVDNFRADVGNSDNMGSSMVDTDLILNSFAHVTSTGSCFNVNPYSSAVSGP